jgi:hypothetical protein
LILVDVGGEPFGLQPIREAVDGLAVDLNGSRGFVLAPVVPDIGFG